MVRKCGLLLLAALSSVAVWSAEVVAKFTALTEGAKSGSYSVSDGRTLSGGTPWSQADGMTVVLSYSGYTAGADCSFIALKQSNKVQADLIGIGARSGKFFGVYNGGMWSSSPEGSAVPASGTLVFTYSAVGVNVYLADGTSVFSSPGLKETGTDITLGSQIDIGALNNGTLASGITVEKVVVLNGTTASDGVTAAAGLAATTPATAFTFNNGSNPSGWFKSWKGEADGAPINMVKPDGSVGALNTCYFVSDSSKWHPYSVDMSAKSTFSLATYGCTDLIPNPADGTYAVLWATGWKDEAKTVLAMDSSRRVALLQMTATTINQSVVAEAPTPGYHLYTVTFDTTKGASLTIDGGTTKVNAAFTTLATAGGLQIGSILKGCSGATVKGLGFVPVSMLGYDAVLDRCEILDLARAYPSVTSVTCSEIGTTGDVYLPNVSVGDALSVGEGATLVVAAHADRTLGAVLSGAGALAVEGSSGAAATFGAANTFTGGFTVRSGTAKTSSATGFGPNNYEKAPDSLATVMVQTGATLDLANTADTSYAITAAGTVTNSGSAIGPTTRQTRFITLSGDATVSGNQFGLLGSQYASTTLALGDHTLTVDMATADTTFILCNATVSGTGRIRLEQGRLYVKKSVKGTLNIDLPSIPAVGTALLALDNDRDLSALTLNVTVDGAGLPPSLSVSALGVIEGTDPVVRIEKDESARTWLVDTTEAPYKFTASDVTELRNTAWKVTVMSDSHCRATLDFGTSDQGQAAHYVIASGHHEMKWFNNNSTLAFDTKGRDDDPTILVKGGATLDFYAKDVTGWINEPARASNSVIRVNDGGTLNLYRNGSNTFFYQGRIYLEPGGLIAAQDFESDKFRLNGGILDSWQELYVPAPTGQNATAVYSSNVGFRLASNNTTGYGICVEDGATLELRGALTSDGARDLGKFGDGTLVITGSLSGMTGKIKIAGGSVKVKTSSGIAEGTVEMMTVDENREIGVTQDGEWTVYRLKNKVEFDPEKDTLATEAVLRFSEIMPKPSDKPGEITTQAGYDKNGLESGWVELENPTDMWVDLKDYKFMRANRGKAYNQADYGNFPSVLIPPHGRYTFYTSERYSNSAPEAKDGNTSAWQHGTFDGKPIFYGDMLVWGDKVNPKKYPLVTLAYAPAGAAETIVDTVVIPSDTPEGYSIVVGPKDASSYTQRWLCPAPTFNAANGDTASLVKLGPNVGPLYGVKHSVDEFGAVAPAVPGQAYTVTLNVNPVHGGTEKDAIAKVVLVYRTKLDKGASGEIEMTKAGTDAGGDLWTAEIPAEAIPTEPGQVIQWKTRITDAAANVWTSPSFNNPDDGYQWYGTITEPTGLVSAKLPTWHLFVDDASKSQMDLDEPAQTLSNNARVAIYDSTTSNYYDYVRIDLRGHTSAHFTKKGHGLRFSKVHPLTMKDAVTGKSITDIRKTSLISEFADPSYIRQMLSFWLFNQAQSPAPFDFPVRCNLNGEFYQVAFNSERFTDELIEDVYGLDKYGYGYKNIGTFAPSGTTSAGGIEKKTPDDGNESDMTRLRTFTSKLSAASKVAVGKDASSADTGLENAALTQTVATEMDLPAWFNYLAIARITSECDDVWANLSGYCDEAEMKEGRRGTSTWRPLVYDTNLSWGQHYNDGALQRGLGLKANADWFKSHPFYGGFRIRAYVNDTLGSTVGNANYAVEAIWQHAKYRRLYLRRLRTLMDTYLGETAEGETFETSASPIVVQMRAFAELLREDAADDLKKWPYDSSDNAIDVWTDKNRPANMDAGIREIYTNYIVPRRTHLFVTHAESNAAKTTGYATELKAGIPARQSAIAALKDGLSAEAVAGGVVIRNANAETIDLSGWDVSGPVVMKLPAGTVIDQGTAGDPAELFVVTDRVAYVAANTVTDQLIVGNATAGSGTDVGLTAADGTVVLSADVILQPGTYTGVSYDVPVRLAPAGSFTFQGVAFNGGLTLGEGAFTLKNQNGCTNTASVVSAPDASIAFTGKGAFELVGTAATVDPLMDVGDLYVSNGVFSVESKATTEGVKAVVVKGNFAVEDKGTVSVKLSKKTVSGIGISQELKNKFCRIGKGGTFLATVNGAGGRALASGKGTVELTVQAGATVTAEGVGANARFFKMDGNIRIEGGTLDLRATGSGTELLSSGKTVFISGGDLHLESTDDCVSATTAIAVSGGTVVGKSSANDVLDSNGTISISGGTLILLATAEGHEGLDSDPNPPDEAAHAITITGGTVYSLGGANCDLRLPETGGQAYAVKEVSSEAGVVSVTAGGATHVFVKPAGGRTALVSLPGLSGTPTEAVSWPTEATVVIPDCYVTYAATQLWESVVVTDATALADLLPAEQAAKLVALKVTPATLAAWAKTHHAKTETGTALDLAAFAFNCAPGGSEEPRKNFRLTIAIAPDGTPVVAPAAGVTLNVEPTIQGSDDLKVWHDKTAGDHFFKAVIDL